MATDDDIQVMVCPANPTNPRNSEASILVRGDGTLLMAYSRFYGGGGDEAAADISGRTSNDGGRTWSEPFQVQRNDGRQNVMSVCLLRLQSGRVGMAYARKNSDAVCGLYWRVSDDDACTWSSEVRVSPAWGYGATGPDVLVQLSSGRLLAPDYRTTDWQLQPQFRGYPCWSDDEGQTWQHAAAIELPGGRSLEEPCIVELRDGRLLMFTRNVPGPMFQTFSADGGATWSAPEPSPLVHPRSPMQLRRLPSTGDLLCIWNDSNAHRYPLTAAVSSDDGRTWPRRRHLEVETPGVTQFAYSSVVFHAHRALMTYWVIDGAGINLKFRSVPESWFYGE